VRTLLLFRTNHWFSLIQLDFHRSLLIFIDVHRFSSISLKYHRFPLTVIYFHESCMDSFEFHICLQILMVFMDLHGFEKIFIDFHIFSNLFPQVQGPECPTPCAALRRPVPPCRRGLDPSYIEFCSSRGLDLDACRCGCLDTGCWQDCRGLERVAARWEEGIGRKSHALELEELGGYRGSNPLPQDATGQHKGSDILAPGPLGPMDTHRNL
jgi:hypothetical protein